MSTHLLPLEGTPTLVPLPSSASSSALPPLARALQPLQEQELQWQESLSPSSCGELQEPLPSSQPLPLDASPSPPPSSPLQPLPSLALAPQSPPQSTLAQPSPLSPSVETLAEDSAPHRPSKSHHHCPSSALQATSHRSARSPFQYPQRRELHPRVALMPPSLACTRIDPSSPPSSQTIPSHVAAPTNARKPPTRD